MGPEEAGRPDGTANKALRTPLQQHLSHGEAGRDHLVVATDPNCCSPQIYAAVCRAVKVKFAEWWRKREKEKKGAERGKENRSGVTAELQSCLLPSLTSPQNKSLCISSCWAPFRGGHRQGAANRNSSICTALSVSLEKCSRQRVAGKVQGICRLLVALRAAIQQPPRHQGTAEGTPPPQRSSPCFLPPHPSSGWVPFLPQGSRRDTSTPKAIPLLSISSQICLGTIPTS